MPAGGPFFNLFNLGKDPKEMKTLKLKEIKNGRLAMLAVFGYGAQVSGSLEAWELLGVMLHAWVYASRCSQ
jgi:hypothetical protein